MFFLCNEKNFFESWEGDVVEILSDPLTFGAQYDIGHLISPKSFRILRKPNYLDNLVK